MTITLDPPTSELGVAAPFVGPWFRPATLGTIVTLPAVEPGGSLGLTIDLGNDGTEWLPPATGTLSLFVAPPANPPLPIAHLQDANGDFPFESGKLVAWFRLLPEVEERLQDLSRLIPPVTGATLPIPPTTPFVVNQRARVRGFAMVPQLATLDHDALMVLLGGETNVPGLTDRDRLRAVGLDIDQTGIVNGNFPMTRLRRPGRFQFDPSVPPGQDALLSAISGEVELWAFDHRGRALDPGAVAAWWSWLMNNAVGATAPGEPFQLFAPGINPADLPQANGRPLLCGIAPGRSAHFVDAHEGLLGAPFIDGRLLVDGATIEEELVLTSTDPLQVSFKPLDPPTTTPPIDNPPVDSAPSPRVALLPAGAYGTSLTLWPDGAAITPGLERDFVRVAVVDEERHLVGIERRDSRDPTDDPDERRSSNQNRPSTRTTVAPTASNGPVLLATADDAAIALDLVLTAPGPTRAVLGIADAEAGPAGPGLLATAGAPFPIDLRESASLGAGTYRVRALAGGGAADGNQAVLLEVELGAAHDGVWLRAWPLGFLLEVGLRPRITGGGGRVLGGRATMVLTLPAGRVDGQGLLSFDMQLSRLDGAGEEVTRLYADCRFERPAALTGAPAATISGDWVICETGVTGSGALPAGAVPPGASVVLLGNPPAIVDRTAIPAAARTPDSLVNRLAAGDVVSLTAPAFTATADRLDPLGRLVPRATPGGDRTGGLGAILGGAVHLLGREDFSGTPESTASSTPLALQDRLEVAAASVTGGATPSAIAMLSGGPRLPSFHEQLPHHLGHPGVRAAIETHATGVLLDGAPAVAVAEYVRERTSGLSFAEVRNAAEPLRSIAVQSELAVAAEAVPAFPTLPPGAGPGPVVAILRTGPVGQEGIPGLALLASTLAAFPLSEHGSALQDFLNNTNLPGGAGPLGNFLRSQVGNQFDSLTRALDRRLLVGARGAREAALALAAAFDRAQDFVYIETPALDHREHGPDDDRLDLLGHLLDRLSARRGLRVILCAPSRLSPGTPKKLQAIRDAELLGAIADLRAAAPDRIAMFSPGAGAGRALRLATTTVIVDDVFALTGTTHLWRRGLTFDSSLAAAVFDERLVDGRPQEVRAFRRQLLADRLGLPTSRIPDDPDELVRAIRVLDETAPSDDFGTRPSQRRSAVPILAPDEAPTNIDIDTWNADGSRADLDLGVLFGAIALTDPDHAVVDD